VFVLPGTLGPGIPVAIYFLIRDRAAEILESLRGSWRARTRPSSPYCALIIGAKLIGEAISALAA
jgi:hypothetical protein